MKIAVIGNGIAAWSAIYWLSRLTKVQLEIHQYFCHQTYPACSENSTATVCLRGTRQGLSPLGDLMVDGKNEWDEFFRRENLSSIHKVPFYFEWDPQNSRERTRYENLKLVSEASGRVVSFQEGYFIDWKEYKKELHNLVVETKKIDLHSHTQIFSETRDPFDRIIWATGAYSESVLPKMVQVHKRENSVGYYWEGVTADRDINESYSKDGFNTIHLGHLRRALIGSFKSIEELQAQFSKVGERYGLKISDGEIKCGVRAKGKKRMPFYSAADDTKREYFLGHFYKNGFLLSHICAKKMIEQFLSDQKVGRVEVGR